MFAYLFGFKDGETFVKEQFIAENICRRSGNRGFWTSEFHYINFTVW